MLDLKEKFKSARIAMLRLLLGKIATKPYLEGDNFLIMIPHPDDEVFGLGGWLSQMRREFPEKKIWLLYLTDGGKSLSNYPTERIVVERRKIRAKVLSQLGISEGKVIDWSLPDGELPRSGEPLFEQLSMQLESLAKNCAIDTILAPHPLEYWPFDHLAAYELARCVSDRTGKSLYGYWVWTWYNLSLPKAFKQDYSEYLRLEIKDQLEIKKELTNLYMSSLAPCGQPWSGSLPKPFVQAFDYPFEIMEKLR